MKILVAETTASPGSNGTTSVAGMDAGADDYLTTPFDPFDLETRLISAERVTALHAELQRYRTELAGLAYTDPLTQLHNRLALDEDLATPKTGPRRSPGIPARAPPRTTDRGTDRAKRKSLTDRLGTG